MVKIRLRRVGGKNKSMYRIVVADSRAPRDGAFLEVIGHYNPLTDPETVAIDKEKATKWLGCGARPTETAVRLLVKSEVEIPERLRPKLSRRPIAAKSKSKKSITETETTA